MDLLLFYYLLYCLWGSSSCSVSSCCGIRCCGVCICWCCIIWCCISCINWCCVISCSVSIIIISCCIIRSCISISLLVITGKIDIITNKQCNIYSTIILMSNSWTYKLSQQLLRYEFKEVEIKLYSIDSTIWWFILCSCILL